LAPNTTASAHTAGYWAVNVSVPDLSFGLHNLTIWANYSGLTNPVTDTENLSVNYTKGETNFTSNIGNIRFNNCSPDWEFYPSIPIGQTADISVINVTNNGTATDDFQIEYTGSINTGWTLFACNATSAADPQADSTNCLTLSDSWQTIWSDIAVGLNKSVWLYANCSNVSANPGVNIDMRVPVTT